MGFFLYEWRSHEYRKKNFLTNHEWLSRRDEIKIPHARRSRKWGIFILSQLLSHDVMSEEIYPSLFLSRPGVTFPFLRGKFQHRIFHVFIRMWSMVNVHIDCFNFGTWGSRPGVFLSWLNQSLTKSISIFMSQ